MKAKLLISVLLVMMACAVYAQDYSSYLNKAMEKLEAGDCRGAQNLYNVYKELSGKSMSSVEVLIADCNRSSEKTYSVGDTMHVGKEVYEVAFVRDGGRHGFAICNLGWGYLSSYKNNISRQEIPTLDELKIIYQSRDILRMYNKYWSRTHCENCGHSKDCCFAILDFG